MTASPGKPIEMFGDFDNDAHIKDPRGYCLCCSMEVAHWTSDERFTWMFRFKYSAPCERCPSVASDRTRQTLARRRFEWLQSQAQKIKPDDIRPCDPMPDDPQPQFWTEEARRGR